MRAYTLILSIVAHVAAVGVVIVAPLVATDALPRPRRAVEFIHVMPTLITPPPPPRQRAQATTAPNLVSSAAAPMEPPTGIHPEPKTPAELPVIEGSMVEGLQSMEFVAGIEPLPPPSAEREPIRVGGVISRPERVWYVAPVYPPLARTAHVEGTVILEAVLGADGVVREVRVLRSIPLLDAAALQAVQQWQFTPTLLNGEAVPVVLTVTVVFSLR